MLIGEFVKHAGWCNAEQFDENKTHEGGNSNSLNYKWLDRLNNKRADCLQ